MVGAAFDSKSEVAGFPEKFSTDYAERFIGSYASTANQKIADLIDNMVRVKFIDSASSAEILT